MEARKRFWEKTKKEQLKSIENTYNSIIKECREYDAYLAKNYYDCIDDYSYCGLSSKMNEQRERRIEYYRDKMTEQAKNGYIKIEDRDFGLFDLEGNLVTFQIVHTRFGLCWVTNDGRFISVPKKQETLKKKGFVAKDIVKTYHCNWDGSRTKNEYPIFENITLVETTYAETQLESVYQKRGLAWITYLYDNRRQ